MRTLDDTRDGCSSNVFGRIEQHRRTGALMALMRRRGHPAENAVVPELTKKELSVVVEFV